MCRIRIGHGCAAPRVGRHELVGVRASHESTTKQAEGAHLMGGIYEPTLQWAFVDDAAATKN